MICVKVTFLSLLKKKRFTTTLSSSKKKQYFIYVLFVLTRCFTVFVRFYDYCLCLLFASFNIPFVLSYSQYFKTFKYIENHQNWSSHTIAHPTIWVNFVSFAYSACFVWLHFFVCVRGGDEYLFFSTGIWFFFVVCYHNDRINVCIFIELKNKSKSRDTI